MIPGIILAAGRSSRMGRPKALLPLNEGGGETFIQRIAYTFRAAGVEDVIAVLGHQAATIREACAALNVDIRMVENRDYDRGQLSSLLTALMLVDRPGVQGVLVTLVDLPLVEIETVRAVLAAYRSHPDARTVRPVKGNRHGHPVLFDRLLFDELRRTELDRGARAVVQRHRDQAVEIEVADEGAFTDIDTPEDYERIVRGRWK